MADLKYVHLLSFARIGETETEIEGMKRPTVVLLNGKGEPQHSIHHPLIFRGPLPPNRVFDTVLDDELSTPVKLINILAEFDENQFNEHKANIPSLTQIEWDGLAKSNNLGGMTPIIPPIRR
ncbi:hypothetical protein [Spirosoma arcticum]